MTQRRQLIATVASPQARTQIDADALHAAVAKQRAQDAAHPPSRHLSKMAAVRIVADLIAARRDNGWTDAQIVALLGDQLGVDIPVATLRVYIHRLRSEGSFPKMSAGSTVSTNPDMMPAPAQSTVANVPAHGVSPVAESASIATSEARTDQQDPASNPRGATGPPPIVTHDDDDDAADTPPHFSGRIDLDEDV